MYTYWSVARVIVVTDFYSESTIIHKLDTIVFIGIHMEHPLKPRK